MQPSRHTMVLLFLFATAACKPGGTTPDTGGTSPGVAEAVAPTVVELATATYSGILEQPVTLIGGRWEGEPFVDGGASRPTVGLVDHFILTGDLDGDGADEAVAVLWESSGGSGNRLYLTVMERRDGTIENLGTTLIGDRVQIRSGAIEENRITLDVVRAGVGDAACCPSEKAEVTWVLDEDGLTRTGDEMTGTLSLADLEGHEWYLVELGWEQPVPDEADITLLFRDERVAGQSACNSYFAGVAAAGPGKLTFTGMGATRMACPEPQMELERRYLKTLAGASRYSFLAGRLALTCTTDAGSKVLVFAPRQAPPSDGAGGG